MAKKIFDDMAPRPRQVRRPQREEREDEDEVEIRHRQISRPSYARKTRSKKGWVVLFIVILLVGGIYFLSSLLSHAEVEVSPRTELVEVASTFNASRGGKDGAIHFEGVKLSATDSVSIPTTSEEKVERKASGTIVVYNAYTAKPQALVENTRFRSSNGKIFRVLTPVTIPGATNVGGTVTPGSLEITIEADAVGPDYNVGLTDFVIPGFEGTPKFTKFYGRSKTAIGGGYVGTAKIAPPEAVKAAHRDLQQKLGTRLSEEVIKEIPDGYVGYPNSLFVSFVEAPPRTASATSTDVVLSGTATVQGVIIKSDELAKAIAHNSVRDYAGDDVEILGLGTLGFTLLGKDTINYDTVGSIAFRLEGPAKVVWQFDEEAFKKAIAGAPVNEFTAIFKDFPVLRSVRPTVNPPWARRIPADISKISVTHVVQ